MIGKGKDGRGLNGQRMTVFLCPGTLEKPQQAVGAVDVDILFYGNTGNASFLWSCSAALLNGALPARKETVIPCPPVTAANSSSFRTLRTFLVVFLSAMCNTLLFVLDDNAARQDFARRNRPKRRLNEAADCCLLPVIFVKNFSVGVLPLLYAKLWISTPFFQRLKIFNLL